MSNQFLSWCGTSLMAIAGSIIAFLQPTFPFILLCTIAVALDIGSAMLLRKRVINKMGIKGKIKLQSKGLAKAGMTLLRIYGLVIFVHCIEQIVFEGMNLRLANIVCGAVCFSQIWSILENESSQRNSKWARILQKVMIDKSERWLGIDLNGDGIIDNSKNAPRKELINPDKRWANDYNKEILHNDINTEEDGE